MGDKVGQAGLVYDHIPPRTILDGIEYPPPNDLRRVDRRAVGQLNGPASLTAADDTGSRVGLAVLRGLS